jgi:DNA-binding MarR family transcriptional regulator
MPRAKINRSTKTASPDGGWLDDGEQAAWRALAAVMVKLPWALECQLQRDAGLSFIEYHVLARLSENPEHTWRMSELAELTNASLSRLSHLVKRLESRGLVRREPDPMDGRFTNAMLTKAGYAKLVSSAPAHVDTVRSLVVDALSPAELQLVGRASQRLLENLQTAAEAPVSG